MKIELLLNHLSDIDMSLDCGEYEEAQEELEFVISELTIKAIGE